MNFSDGNFLFEDNEIIKLKGFFLINIQGKGVFFLFLGKNN